MRINKLVLIFFASALLGACGNKESVNRAEEANPEKLVKLISWSEYFDLEVFANFSKESGIQVDYITYDDPDELEARLASEPGQFDVVVADDLSINRLAELRLVQPLDKSALPNLKNVSIEYLGRTFDPKNSVSVPYLWGTTLIAYRSDKITAPENSWNSLWDESYKGKAMILNDRTEGLGIGMIAHGFPINSSEPDHMNIASDALVDAIKNVDMRFGSDAEVRAGLLSGDVWIASCYSGDAAMVAEDNENVSFFIPKEGAPLWMDNFSIASDASNVTGSHLLVDYMLRKKSAAMNANFTWYGTTNSAALPLINKDLLEDETINPPLEVRSLCQFYYVPDTDRDTLLNAAWSKVVDALREKLQHKAELKIAGSSGELESRK